VDYVRFPRIHQFSDAMLANSAEPCDERMHSHLIVRLPPSPLPPRLADLRDQHLDLDKLPAHDVLEHVQREALDTLVEKHQRVQADVLEARVLGPAADGHLPHVRDHVDVAGIGDVAAHLVVDLEGAAHALAGLSKERVPPEVDVVLRRYVGEGADVELDVLEIAAGLRAAEGLAVQRRPVRDGAVQVADVHEVEVVRRVGPGQLGVVDLEAQVRGDPGRLNRADVDAGDLGGGELIGDIAAWVGTWIRNGKD